MQDEKSPGVLTLPDTDFYTISTFSPMSPQRLYNMWYLQFLILSKVQGRKIIWLFVSVRVPSRNRNHTRNVNREKQN